MPEKSTGVACNWWILREAAGFPLCPLAIPAEQIAARSFLRGNSLENMGHVDSSASYYPNMFSFMDEIDKVVPSIVTGLASLA